MGRVVLMIVSGIIGGGGGKKEGREVYYKVEGDVEYGKMGGEGIGEGVWILIGGVLVMLGGFL
ncbi:FxsA family protein [Bacillus subtilis]|uniref:FxsA family protein n=1 Tax=Bacillus subtilis TaxID=1423 RepID=UPI00338FF876